MKSFTDIPQSKKLAEILPIESADMNYFEPFVNSTDSPDEIYGEVRVGGGGGLPAWSLAALLDILKNPMLLKYDGSWHIYNEDIKCLDFDNSIDACYEMILKLHEKGLL